MLEDGLFFSTCHFCCEPINQRVRGCLLCLEGILLCLVLIPECFASVFPVSGCQSQSRFSSVLGILPLLHLSCVARFGFGKDASLFSKDELEKANLRFDIFRLDRRSYALLGRCQMVDRPEACRASRRRRRLARRGCRRPFPSLRAGLHGELGRGLP